MIHREATLLGADYAAVVGVDHDDEVLMPRALVWRGRAYLRDGERTYYEVTSALLPSGCKVWQGACLPPVGGNAERSDDSPAGISVQLEALAALRNSPKGGVAYLKRDDIVAEVGPYLDARVVGDPAVEAALLAKVGGG